MIKLSSYHAWAKSVSISYHPSVDVLNWIGVHLGKFPSGWQLRLRPWNLYKSCFNMEKVNFLFNFMHGSLRIFCRSRCARCKEKKKEKHDYKRNVLNCALILHWSMRYYLFRHVGLVLICVEMAHVCFGIWEFYLWHECSFFVVSLPPLK